MITIVKETKINKVIFPYFHESDLPSYLNEAVTLQLNHHFFDNTIVCMNPDTNVLEKYRFVLVEECGNIYHHFHEKLIEVFSKIDEDYAINLSAIKGSELVDIKQIMALIGETYKVANYKFYACYKKCSPKYRLDVVLNDYDESDKGLADALQDGLYVGMAINHARVLGDMPSNYLTPSIFVESIQELVRKLKNDNVSMEIFDKTKLEEMGAGALLGVNKGSAEGAYMVVLKYQGAQDEPFTALVGKGLTFDSGGYNLKTTGGLGMKYDMCGAANVLGAFELIVNLKLSANVYAVLPITENLLDANSYRSDDVLVSLSKKTIEVTNTDAEGRLILCDALTYAVKLGATRIIDVATLTGAIGTALGNNYTGAFTNSIAFLEKLRIASDKAKEPIWQLPVGEEYAKHLKKSKVADLVNSAKVGGGASVAASFLQQFIPDFVEWIHLDIASTATTSADSEATGVMVKTLAFLFTI